MKFHKPHPASIAKENFINKVKLTNEDLEYLIETHKYIVSSNSTSAIIEALSCGRKTFLFIDKSNFDLSPIKNTKNREKVDFFYTKKDLVYKIKNCKHNFEPIEYYYLDKELKKWKKELKIQ